MGPSPQVRTFSIQHSSVCPVVGNVVEPEGITISLMFPSFLMNDTTTQVIGFTGQHSAEKPLGLLYFVLFYFFD